MPRAPPDAPSAPRSFLPARSSTLTSPAWISPPSVRPCCALCLRCARGRGPANGTSAQAITHRALPSLPPPACCLHPPPHPVPQPRPAPGPAGDQRERSEAVAVGTWGMEAHIYALPGLRPLFKEALPTDVIPRRHARWPPPARAPPAAGRWVLGAACRRRMSCARPLERAPLHYSLSTPLELPLSSTSSSPPHPHPPHPRPHPAAPCLPSLTVTRTCCTAWATGSWSTTGAHVCSW